MMEIKLASSRQFEVEGSSSVAVKQKNINGTLILTYPHTNLNILIRWQSLYADEWMFMYVKHF